MLLLDYDSQKIVEVVLMIAILAISLALHELCHAAVALWCGDTTARDMGRLTPDPRAHIDPFMTILLPALLWLGSDGRMMFGGAKPVPVSYSRLRHPARDMMLVALAGPLCNLVLAFLFAGLLKLSTETGYFEMSLSHVDLGAKVLIMSVRFNVLLAVFNMLPIPPLDGSRVMAYFLSPRLRDSYHAMERFGMLIVFGLLFTGVLNRFIMPPMTYLSELIWSVTGLGS